MSLSRGLSGLLLTGLLALTPGAHAQSILTGPITRADLKKPPFAEWFDRHYSAYQPAVATIDKLREAFRGLTVEAYFGTWCGDSKRQIPRLLRLLDASGFDEEHLTMVGLSDQAMEFKKAPGGLEAKRRIHRTPTIVLVRDGVEIGRIVETPSTSLEADMLAILSGRSPEPRYGAEAWVHQLLSDRAAPDAEKALQTAAPEISKRTDPDSLWHYAEYDLLRNGRAREAKAVLDLHLSLHPRSVAGHILLAEALAALGRKSEALAALDRALAIDPGNTRARTASEKLRAPSQP